MVLSRIKGDIRIIWRDIILYLTDSTVFLDDILNAFMFADTGYQYMWNKPEVHRTLLKDEVRIKFFNDAIKEKVTEDDTVLDVGTGTGILAMLAAKAGAKKVVGIDSSNIINLAKKAAKKTKLKNVEFIRCDLRDLNIEKADVIICELIGMYITDEGMTYKMKDAVKHLKEGGRLIPEKIDIYVAPIQSDDVGAGFWKEMYGIDYSVVESAPYEIRNYDLSKCKILSKPHKIAEIDFYKNDVKTINYVGEFEIETDGFFHGAVMYFEVKLSENIILSTAPTKPLTHWKQIFLPNKKTKKISKNDIIKFEIRGVMNNTKWKWNFS